MSNALQIATLVFAVAAAGLAGTVAIEPDPPAKQAWIVPGVVIWGTPQGDPDQYFRLGLSLMNPGKDTQVTIEFIGEENYDSCGVTWDIASGEQVRGFFFRDSLEDLGCMEAGGSQYSWNGYLKIQAAVVPEAHITTIWPDDVGTNMATRALHAYAVTESTSFGDFPIARPPPVPEEEPSRTATVGAVDASTR